VKMAPMPMGKGTYCESRTKDTTGVRKGTVSLRLHSTEPGGANALDDTQDANIAAVVGYTRVDYGGHSFCAFHHFQTRTNLGRQRASTLWIMHHQGVR